MTALGLASKLEQAHLCMLTSISHPDIPSRISMESVLKRDDAIASPYYDSHGL